MPDSEVKTIRDLNLLSVRDAIREKVDTRAGEPFDALRLLRTGPSTCYACSGQALRRTTFAQDRPFDALRLLRTGPSTRYACSGQALRRATFAQDRQAGEKVRKVRRVRR
jgi:nucleoid-associated protein YgaU